MDPDRDGVPLAHYLEHLPEYGVRFICRDCNLTTDVPLVDVVDRLKARGLGDERTGIRALARLATRPCSRCGSKRWETRPARPSGG